MPPRTHALFRLAARLALAAALAAAVGCASVPPSEAHRPEVHHEQTHAAHAEAAQAEAQSRSGAKVLATVGDTAVLALAAPGFSDLSREERLLAYWLAQAGRAGDAIAWDQGYRHNLAVVRIVRDILSHPQAVPADVLVKVRDYARRLYLNRGMHDATTERKIAPPFTPAELRTAALAAQAAGASLGLSGARLDTTLRALEGPLFDPRLDAVRTDKAPEGGQDPLRASAVNLYAGVGLRDLEGFREAYPLNSRLVKEGGQLLEQVYRAGSAGRRDSPAVPKGLYADRLARAAAALDEAQRHAAGPQREAISRLATYLRSGDPEEFRLAQRVWVSEAFAVDGIVGFIETYAAPRGQKGLWEGFVGFVDQPRTEALRKLASAAQALEDRAPWPEEYRRKSIRTPVVEAVFAASGSGDARPLGFSGANLPNEQAERDRSGSKSLLLAALDDALGAARGLRMTAEFAPTELAADLVRCRSDHRFAFLALHEIAGHAGGATAVQLAGKDPGDVLRENYNTLEVARADLVAHWHATDPLLRDLGLFPDKSCQALYPSFAALEWLTYVAEVPQGDRVEEDHQRGQQLMLWWFTQKQAVATRRAGGKTYLVVPDEGRFHRAAGDLLSVLQTIKSTGDTTLLKGLVEAHAMRLDPALRDEVLARMQALGLPRRVAALPPLLKPVLADGKLADAQLEPVADLDAQILADWADF